MNLDSKLHITPNLQGAPTYTYHKQYMRKLSRSKFYDEKIDLMNGKLI